MSEVVQVTGRWASLRNGDFVTAIPAFKDLGYDAIEFDNRITLFQRDPNEYLRLHPLVQMVSKQPRLKQTQERPRD